MDLQSDSAHWAELGERPTVKLEGSCVQFSVVKVSDDEWRLLDEGGEGNLTGAAATTEALFNLVRQQMEGEDFIVVAHGTDPRVVKKEMADQGREPEQPRFFSISETIELNSEDDEEDLPVRELTRNGKSSFEKVRRCPIVAIQFCWCPYSELWLAH